LPLSNYHTVRQTAAAAITLPRAGLWLALVRVHAGATPGAFQYRYAGSAQATWAAPSNGTRGRRAFAMREQIAGTQIPAGAQTFTGGVDYVELIFTVQAPSRGASFADQRGIVLSRTDAGATTATITGNYDVAPARPRAVEAYISASAGRVQFPAIDLLTPQVEAIVSEIGDPDYDTIPAPPFSPSNSITPSVITDGASTIVVVIYYDPA
jgi:hypothetical protein